MAATPTLGLSYAARGATPPFQRKIRAGGGLQLAFMEGASPAEHSCRHVALAVANEYWPACKARWRALGTDMRPLRIQVKGEGPSLDTARHRVQNTLSAESPAQRLNHQPRMPHAPTLHHPDLRRYPLLQGLHMADDPDHLAAGVE